MEENNKSRNERGPRRDDRRGQGGAPRGDRRPGSRPGRPSDRRFDGRRDDRGARGRSAGDGERRQGRPGKGGQDGRKDRSPRGGKFQDRRDDRRSNGSDRGGRPSFGSRRDGGNDRSRDFRNKGRRDGDRQRFARKDRADAARKRDFEDRRVEGRGERDVAAVDGEAKEGWDGVDRYPHEFFASCPSGIEMRLAAELKSFGIRKVRPLRGGVTFFGQVKDAYVACMWSRLASRVFYVVGRCDCKTADELYDGVRAMAWSHQIPVGKTVSVYGHGTNAELRNTQFTALRAKDAICDSLRAGRGKRPDVNLQHPDVLIDVGIRDERATVSIDLVGTSLHHRSYEDSGKGKNAGFKGALAALVLENARWRRAARQGMPLVDPLCRDGYVVTEAAMVAADMAPGLVRPHWGFDGWAMHDEAAFEEVVDEADARLEEGLASVPLIYAFATDARVRANVCSMLKRAGLASCVTVIDSEDEGAVKDALKALEGEFERLDAKRAEDIVRLEAEHEAAEEQFRIDMEAYEAALSEREARASEERESEGAEEAVSAPDAEEAVSASEDQKAEGAEEQEEAASAETAADELEKPRPPRRLRLPDEVHGVAACVLPLGQDGEDALSLATYRELAARLDALPRTWKFAVASDDDTVERMLESMPVTRPDLARFGRVKAFVRLYDETVLAEHNVISVFDAGLGADRELAVLDPGSDQFAARLKKNAKDRRKWSLKEHVSCYRVYDADLPDFAVSIDVYNGAQESRGKTYLVVSEYQAPAQIDPGKAKCRMRDVLTIAPIVLGVEPDKVFTRTRRQDKGGSQYSDAASRSFTVTVEENGNFFECDLGGYLDTGLFLDHRLTRERVGELAEGRTFLNLFAYTGTATVHAATCGAASTTTIDLSQTYLNWAERNMVKNGFEGKHHRYVRSDVLQWIANERRTSRRYGLVFVDPPTFSNSKSMGKETWSVERDHVKLLEGVTALLEKGGVAVFSCNLRSFKMDQEALAELGIVFADVTAATIPYDFARNPKIHHCFVVARKGDEDALEAARAVMEGER